MQARLTLFVGERNAGKTTALQGLLRQSRSQKKRLCGMLALANPEKTVYRLKDISSNEERLALSAEPMGEGRRIGRFYLDDNAFHWANRRILQDLKNAEVVLFDEIGRLELSGAGLAPSFREALEIPGLLVFAAVRLPFVQDVLAEFSIPRENVKIQYVGKDKQEGLKNNE
ncbi:MAG: nucleoside-triphosphatase [Sphaerochaetaceae bacterium]